jgi:hypothetical protein
MLPKDCGPSSVVFSDIIMLQRCLNDIIMSLNSIYMLVKVFNDIIMLQRCLNDIIMFWEQKGARLRGMSHTHRHCDSAYCCADLSHQHDVCCLKQTCTPKGAARKYLTTVTNVMILTRNYAVGLEVARGTQSNTQGVWPCKLPIDSLPPQLLAKSPKLMSDLCKQSRRNFPNAVAG